VIVKARCSGGSGGYPRSSRLRNRSEFRRGSSAIRETGSGALLATRAERSQNRVLGAHRDVRASPRPRRTLHQARRGLSTYASGAGGSEAIISIPPKVAPLIFQLRKSTGTSPGRGETHGLIGARMWRNHRPDNRSTQRSAAYCSEIAARCERPRPARAFAPSPPLDERTLHDLYITRHLSAAPAIGGKKFGDGAHVSGRSSATRSQASRS